MNIGRWRDFSARFNRSLLGIDDEAYKINTRRKFKCKACAHQLSVTSGTIFASRHIDFVDLLAAIFLIVNASKGISMVQLSRDLDCQCKTAFVLAQKLHEAIAQEFHTCEVLDGHVEIDGAYFRVHIRPASKSFQKKTLQGRAFFIHWKKWAKTPKYVTT